MTDDQSRGFGVSVVIDHDDAVISVRGEIDNATERHLRRQLNELLASDSVRRVVIDLADVRFLDSAGIGLLATACRRRTPGGPSIKVVRASPTVSRILDLAGVELSEHRPPPSRRHP